MIKVELTALSLTYTCIKVYLKLQIDLINEKQCTIVLSHKLSTKTCEIACLGTGNTSIYLPVFQRYTNLQSYYKSTFMSTYSSL